MRTIALSPRRTKPAQVWQLSKSAKLAIAMRSAMLAIKAQWAMIVATLSGLASFFTVVFLPYIQDADLAIWCAVSYAVFIGSTYAVCTKGGEK